MVEGKANLSADAENFGELGQRLSVFEKTPPHCVYVPGQSHWQATATTPCTLAVCSAPAKTSRKAVVIGPTGITLQERGKGTNLRSINPGVA